MGASVDSALMDGLSGINAVIADLQAQIDNIATGEDVDNINDTLGGLEEDLSDLLASNNVFTGDLMITSNPTLEFAEALGDKVNIINGNVIITAQSDMDAARLQAVVDKILTITGDLTVRAANSSAPAPTFDNLAGVNNIKIAQAGSISFATLVSARDVIIGDNYASRLDGAVHFGALTLVNSFQTADIGSDAAYTATSIDMDAILVPDASAINLMSLPYYTPRVLSLEADDSATVNIDALKTEDANARARSYTISVKGASSLSGPGLVEGTITLEDVGTVSLPAFTGSIVVNDGVENITLGALGADFPATTSAGNDLVTVDITADAADNWINLTGHANLLSATIAGKIDTVTFSGNTDLETLAISAALENLTINNTSLETASLDYTNSNLAKDASLTVTGNEDLASFSANSVDGLANLTITGNEELETISFLSLESAPTGGGGATVTIGGSGNANAFNATEIEVISADDGSIISDSGIEGLKTYLTAVAAVGASVLNVYFDTADEYVSGGTTTTNLSISTAAHVANLVVVNKVAAADPAAASKRTFFFFGLGGVGIAHDLHFNGAEITITEGNTPADFVADITKAANLAVATTNGVTLTASANAYPYGDAITSMATSTLVSATTASSTGSADSVTLKVGAYSAKLYLVTALDGAFTADPFAADDKSAENQFLVTPGTTTVSNVLDALATEFFGSPFSPYSVILPGGVASGTLRIFAHDVSDKEHGTAVTFTSSNDDAIGTTSINVAGTTADDTLIGNRVQVTLVSNVDGELLSNIGNPPNTRVDGPGITISGAAAGTAGFSASGGGTIWELGASSTETSLAPVTYTEDITDSPGATNVGLEAGTTATPTNRIPWL